MSMDVHDRERTPTEVLIPEARAHQRRRYHRAGIVLVAFVLFIAALIVSAALMFDGPTANGKAQSAPKVGLTAGASGTVFFRPVLCYAPAYAATGGVSSSILPRSTESIPPCSASSALSAANLDVQPQASSPSGFTTNFGSITLAPDPQYRTYPSTSWHKSGYASSTVLLPGIGSACGGPGLRCVVGPAVMTSRSIGTATVSHTQYGSWIVDYTMAGPANAALWDKVAQANFHLLLAVELDGTVYSAPIIQPAQSSFSSFEGRGEISGNLTRSLATHLAKAMSSSKG